VPDQTETTSRDETYPYDRAALRAELAKVAEEPGIGKPDAILEVNTIVRRFGGMTAVAVDHLEVQRGAITALIGPNGAGKTTFFNLITGFDRPTSAKRRFGRPAGASGVSGPDGNGQRVAEWRFNGREMAATTSFRVARAGMVRTFQLTKALAAMTVLDNMLLGAAGQAGERLGASLVRPLWRSQEAANIEKADELLTRFKLHDKRHDYAGSLSGGQRKLLEMARALMSDPAMIMLDEPMAGVNPALTQSLLGHIQDLRDHGTTVLFVEHDMHMVRHISDWVVVMAEGRIVAEGRPQSVMSNQAVIDAYLGSHHDKDLGDDALLEEPETVTLSKGESA